MKLSNKILIGFFGSIFLYLTAVFAEFRLTGMPNIINDKNSIAEAVDVSGIAYVILNDVKKDVKVIGSDRSRLEVRSLTGDVLKKLKYAVSGDTLTLSGFQSENPNTIIISVFVTQTGFRGITVKSSVAIIEKLEQAFLHLSQNSGRIHMSDNKIGKIQMDLSNRSFLDISSTKLDTLSANIEGSDVHIYSPIGIVQGSMKKASFLNLDDIQEIRLKIDESSRLNVSQ
jgi:hypothetical protein